MKNAVYWWEAAPLTEIAHKPVAPTSDVVIVGAGYTGLGAAITLARAGRSVQVFDKQDPGGVPRPAMAASPAGTCGRAAPR
jgi:cation diffusion facilitator CzcD-associated flavoprotein CzcO